MKRLPLRNRSGEVVAYTLVDDQDYERAVAAGPWRRMSDGYVVKSFQEGRRQRALLLHRFILGLGSSPLGTDHIDRDPLNNQRANLRVVTQQQNNQNKSSYRGSSSRFRGVSWYEPRRKWRAQASVNGAIRHLGLFDDEEEAAEAAAAFRRLHMPFSSDASTS